MVTEKFATILSSRDYHFFVAQGVHLYNEQQCYYTKRPFSSTEKELSLLIFQNDNMMFLFSKGFSNLRFSITD